MKKLRFSPLLAPCVFLASFVLAAAQDASGRRTMSRDEILAAGEQTAAAQIRALGPKPAIDWIGAVMWTGMMDLYRADPAHGEPIIQALVATGTEVRWSPILNPKNPFFADDYCFGQAIMDAFEVKKEAVDLKPLRLRCESLAPYLQVTADNPKLLTWSWCDALFMAPAVLVRFTALTGDPRYLAAADREWWKASEVMYDQEDHLFYRDDRFLPSKRQTRSGKKIFWSRGNGWVAAGLTRVLTHLPKDHPSRGKYVAQFREMTDKLASIQRADGSWNPSLVDPEDGPASEFSGTAFYCAAMAWGVNEGLLERGKYLPVAAKAWAALLAMRRGDYLPGYVQAVGDAPGKVARDGTQLYATGGFCMAAVQLAKLAPLDLPPAPTLSESTAPTPAPTATATP